MKTYRILLKFALFISIVMMAHSARADKSFHGVTAFSYVHIGADDHTESSLSPDIFDSHVDEITDGNLTAIKASTLAAMLSRHSDLSGPQPGTVLLTFEGGHKNAVDYAYDRLSRREIPLLINLPTDMIGSADTFLEWSQLRSLASDDLAEFGISGCRYIRLTTLNDRTLRNCLNRAIADFTDQMGFRPRYFSIPYGIYNSRVLNIIKEYNFDLIFGLHSGVIHAAPSSKDDVLPRFPLTDPYGAISRFVKLAKAGALPVKDVIPATPVISSQNNPPTIGFTVTANFDDLNKIQCFLSDVGRVDTKLLGKQRVEVRLNEPLFPGRHRLNCTYFTGSKEWRSEPPLRWFGMMLYLGENTAASNEEPVN